MKLEITGFPCGGDTGIQVILVRKADDVPSSQVKVTPQMNLQSQHSGNISLGKKRRGVPQIGSLFPHRDDTGILWTRLQDQEFPQMVMKKQGDMQPGNQNVPLHCPGSGRISEQVIIALIH